MTVWTSDELTKIAAVDEFGRKVHDDQAIAVLNIP